MTMWPRIGVGLLGSCLAGCFGIDPGGECVDAEVRVVDGDAVVPELGFSAVPVREVAIGTHEVDVFWRSSEQVAYLPGAGASVLAVAVEETGEVRFVESVSDDSEIESGPDDGCPDRLEIDARVRLSTADGALDEVFELPIAAMRPELASIAGERELDELGGDLRVTSQPKDSDLGPLAFDLALGELGAFGTMQLPVVVRGNGFVGATEVELARFPDEEPACEFGVPVAFDQPLGGITGNDTLAVWAAAGPHALVDETGATSALTIELGEAPEILCASVDQRGPASIDIDLHFTSADGRIDGELDVLVNPRIDADGNLERVGFYRDDSGVRPFDPEELESRFGITGVDLEGYDAATLDVHGFVSTGGLEAELTIEGHRPGEANFGHVVTWWLRPG
jgi:hypothetical protein